MVDVNSGRRSLMDKKRGVHLPTRENLCLVGRNSKREKYLETWSGDDIILLIVRFCNDEVVKPARVLVI
jgi:hypothetical protein